MSKASRRKFLVLWRAVLFGGVFGALLFSSGEGIRLLPFSAQLAAASAEWKSERENEYQKNLHRFENQKGSYLTKSQRSNPFDWTNNFGSPKHPATLAAGRQGDDFSARPRSFRSRRTTENHGSRAPPLPL